MQEKSNASRALNNERVLSYQCLVKTIAEKFHSRFKRSDVYSARSRGNPGSTDWENFLWSHINILMKIEILPKMRRSG